MVSVPRTPRQRGASMGHPRPRRRLPARDHKLGQGQGQRLHQLELAHALALCALCALLTLSSPVAQGLALSRPQNAESDHLPFSHAEADPLPLLPFGGRALPFPRRHLLWVPLPPSPADALSALFPHAAQAAQAARDARAHSHRVAMGGSHRRMVQAVAPAIAPAIAPAVAPAVAFAVAPAAAPAPSLAANRTGRRNPLNGLREYDGGWDPFSRDYWASLIWSGVPAVMFGLVWLFLGLAVGLTILLVALFQKAKWTAWRTRDTGKHQKLFTGVMIVFCVGTAALCVVGFAFLCVGQLAFWNQVQADTELVVNATNKATDIVEKVANAMKTIASIQIPIINVGVPGQGKILEISAKALEASAKAQQLAEQTQSQANYYTWSTVVTGIVIGAVLLLLVLCIPAFAFWKLLIMFLIAICLLWFVCFFSLGMLTLWTDAYYFLGDTQAALQQVQADPSAFPVINKIIPCADSTVVSDTLLTARKTVYDTINLLNSGWKATQIPLLGSILGKTRFNFTEICNPFQGPPDYLPSTESCFGLPSLADVFNNLNNINCTVADRICDALEGTDVGKAQVALIVASAALTRLLPDLAPVAKCTYVAGVIQTVINLSQVYYNAVVAAWNGYLILSIGSLVLALLVTVYVLFGTRAKPPLPPEETDAEAKSKEEGLLAGEDARPMEEPSSSFKEEVVVVEGAKEESKDMPS